MDSAKPTLVIRGGTVVDGTGAPPFVADVAVCGRAISAIGVDLPVKGEKEIDARGLLVTPGWVDPHTHYDGQMLWDSFFSPSCNNGVTTLVMGNCGVGVAPVQSHMRDYIVDVCDAVENIPAKSFREVVKWEWETFPEYLETIAQRPFACDYCVLVGHTAVRTWVMGERANMPDRPGGRVKNPVSPEEVSQMEKVVEEAVAAGAFGLSSSRVGLHRDTRGVLVPGSLAEPEELLSLARGIVAGGGGVFELASEWGLYDDVPQRDPVELRKYQMGEWEWMTKVATMCPDKLTFTTGMGTGHDSPESARGHNYFMEVMDRVAKKGGKFWGTPMMRCGMLNFNLASGIHPFILSKTFRQLRREITSVDALVQKMLDPATRAAIISETHEAKLRGSRAMGVYNTVMDNPGMLFPWSSDPEPKPEDALGPRAEREGVTMEELAYDILTHPEAPHAGVLWKSLYNYGNGDLEPLREMIQHPYVVPGFADGGAHLMVQCEATTPTTMLQHWCRDRTRGPKLPLEFVVKKQTSTTAAMMGLYDRGELVPGKQADMNIIDFEKLRVLAPEFRQDLPLGAGRWVQFSEGYRSTIMNGVVTYENGVPTGELPGALVRNPRSVGLPEGVGLKGTVAPCRGSDETDATRLDMTEYARLLASKKGAGMSGVMRAVRTNADTTAKSRL